MPFAFNIDSSGGSRYFRLKSFHWTGLQMKVIPMNFTLLTGILLECLVILFIPIMTSTPQVDHPSPPARWVDALVSPKHMQLLQLFTQLPSEVLLLEGFHAFVSNKAGVRFTELHKCHILLKAIRFHQSSLFRPLFFVDSHCFSLLSRLWQWLYTNKRWLSSTFPSIFNDKHFFD